MKKLLSFAALLICLYSNAQSPVGNWVTIDDNTGKERSVIEIRKSANGQFTGTIVKLFREPSEEQDPLCDKCKGTGKNKRIIGMTIMKNMKQNGDEWNDGNILDPESGSVYDCKIWLDNGKLKVRGYLLFFYRTQTWTRLE